MMFFITLLLVLLHTSSSSPVLSLLVDPHAGNYTIAIDGLTWFLSGDTTVTLGGKTFSARAGTLALTAVATSQGTDGVGAFTSTQLNWTAGAAPWDTEFRVYTDRPAVQFLATWPAGSEAVHDTSSSRTASSFHSPPLNAVPGSGVSSSGGLSAGKTSSTFPSLVIAASAPALGSLSQDPESGNCGWTVVGSGTPTPSGGLLVLAPPWNASAQGSGAPRAAVGFAAASRISTVRQVLAPAAAGGGPPALSAGPAAELELPAGYAMSTLLVAVSASGADPRAHEAAAWGFPPGGSNAALLALGDALLALHNKTRPTPESAGPIYTGLGYSTTGMYFYNPCDGGRWPNGTSPPGRSHMPGNAPCTTYADTLALLRDSLADAQLPPLSHLLLDSFFYGEGIFGGVSLWEDTPELMRQVQSFPAGLGEFVSTLDPRVAVWAHNGRFIAASPYQGRFPFFGGVLPQGPALWDVLFPEAVAGWRLAQIKQDHVAESLAAAGVVTNASVVEAWLGGMADAATRARVAVQYCCSPPSVLHGGVALAAAVGARASPDYVALAHGGVRPLFQWAIGVESAFHWLGLGLLPDKDTTITNSTSRQHGGDGVPPAYAPSFTNFTERNALKHVLAAALSGGPTSFSDAVGAANATLLRALARADGIILRTSRTHTAMDAELNAIMFGAWRGSGGAAGAEAAGAGAAGPRASTAYRLPSARPDSSLPNGNLGEVSSSVTIVGALTWHVITAAQLAAPLDLAPADLAIADADASTYVAVAWDFGTFAPGAVAPAFTPALRLTTGAAYEDAPALIVLAPRIIAGATQWALLGEVGKVVPVSPQRLIAVVGNADGSLVVRVTGAPGEAVTLSACAIAQAGDSWACPRVTASCPAPGTITFPGGTCGV